MFFCFVCFVFSFLVGGKSLLCEIETVFDEKQTKKTLKKSIPHWCSYSSDQQYLSASMAGSPQWGEVLFVVLNCDIILIQKCIFKRIQVMVTRYLCHGGLGLSRLENLCQTGIYRQSWYYREVPLIFKGFGKFSWFKDAFLSNTGMYTIHSSLDFLSSPRLCVSTWQPLYAVPSIPKTKKASVATN